MRGMRWIGVALLLVLIVAQPVMADSGGSTASFGRDVTLEEGERLDGDLLSFGGQVHTMRDSVVDGNLLSLGSVTTIEGRIEGDVIAMGGTVELGSSAVVMGDLVVFGAVKRDRGALVRGSTIEGLEAASRLRGLNLPQPPAEEVAPSRPVAPVAPAAPAAPSAARPTVNQGNGVGRSISVFLITLLMAGVVATLLPGALRRTTDVMRGNWALSLGLGALTLVLGALLSLVFGVLVLVCVGLPLLLALGVLLLVGGLLAWAAAGQIVGQYLAPVLKVSRPSLLVETLLGTAVITIVSNIPCVGPLAGLALLCWGLGAVAMTNVTALQGLPATGRAPFGGPAAPGPRGGGTSSPSGSAPSPEDAPPQAPSAGDTKPLEWPPDLDEDKDPAR